MLMKAGLISLLSVLMMIAPGFADSRDDGGKGYSDDRDKGRGDDRDKERGDDRDKREADDRDQREADNRDKDRDDRGKPPVFGGGGDDKGKGAGRAVTASEPIVLVLTAAGLLGTAALRRRRKD